MASTVRSLTDILSTRPDPRHPKGRVYKRSTLRGSRRQGHPSRLTGLMCGHRGKLNRPGCTQPHPCGICRLSRNTRSKLREAGHVGANGRDVGRRGVRGVRDNRMCNGPRGADAHDAVHFATYGSSRRQIGSLSPRLRTLRPTRDGRATHATPRLVHRRSLEPRFRVHARHAPSSVASTPRVVSGSFHRHA